jgi:hypothetical protein
MSNIGIVTVWRCSCGMRIKVIAEAPQNRARGSQLAACPKCGAKQIVEAERIISIAEDVSDLQSSPDGDHR